MIRRAVLSEKQHNLVGALDDAAQHVQYEFDPEQYRGISTIGFAHIEIPDGRCSFIQTLRRLAESDATTFVAPAPHGRNGYEVTGLGVDLSITANHDSGYRCSITNVSRLIDGPEHQRLDVRERLHRLLLDRLQSHWGYLEDARIYSRMD